MVTLVVFQIEDHFDWSLPNLEAKQFMFQNLPKTAALFENLLQQQWKRSLIRVTRWSTDKMVQSIWRHKARRGNYQFEGIEPILATILSCDSWWNPLTHHEYSCWWSSLYLKIIPYTTSIISFILWRIMRIHFIAPHHHLQ